MKDIQELVKYDVTEAALQTYRDEFLPLTIAGLDDIEGYEKVKQARLFIRGERVNVEKRRVELKAHSLEYGRAVDAEAKRITVAILEVEEHLIAEQKKIDDEEARIKFEKEQREKLPDRLAKLAEVGTEISEAELLTLDDNAFAEVLISLVSAKLERRRLEQEERDRQQKADQERIDAEKRAIEQQKLDAEREAKHKAEVEEAARLAAENAKREAGEEARRKEAERIAAEKAVILELERIEAERPDQEKLHRFADTFTLIQFPDVTGKKAQAKVAKVQKLVAEIISELKAA